jgi:hypothetical protein
MHLVDSLDHTMWLAAIPQPSDVGKENGERLENRVRASS